MLDKSRRDRPKRIAFLAAGLALLAPHALASQMVYTPVNPTFQPGNQLSGSTLLSVAEAQKKRESISTSLTDRSIAETVKASLLSRISSNIYNQIFCSGAGCLASGNFDLGDGNLISFVKTGSDVSITILNPDGSSTVISVPAS